MKREILDDIRRWRDNPRRKPLLLQGARQVGKSWTLREAGNTLFHNCVILNFDRDDDICSLFETTKDPKRLVEQISLIKGEPITEGATLLVFDEVQECNAALNALKYFNEEMPNLPVAAAGSLLGVALKHGGMSFPVGQVDFMTLYPLTFTEFLDAADARLASTLRQWRLEDQIPDALFNQWAEKYKVYLVTGGMPEVVETWCETESVNEVDQTIDAIIKAYELDFSKYASVSDVMRIQQVWDNLQEQLAKESKKFRYSLISKGARARVYESAVNWLQRAGLVHRVYGTETVKMPLMAYKKEDAFKLYLNDIGVLRRLFRLDAKAFYGDHRHLIEFKGVIAENHVLNSIVRQMNVAPVYWTSGNMAEVEFVVDRGNVLVPVEVKSSVNVQAKSLKSYRQKYAPELSVRISMRNLQYADGLLNLPLFMTDRFSDFVDELLK